MKKALVLVLILALVFVGFTGCAKKADGPPKVAFFVKTLNNPFFVTMQEGAEATAAELGIEVYVDGPPAETEVEKQVAMIENAIVDGYDVIVLAPCAKEPLVPVIAKAVKAGIPVINVDDFIDAGLLADADAEVAAFIGSDNFEGGRLAGAHMAELFAGKGAIEVAIIEGMAGVPNAELRRDGFKEGIAGSELTVVASQPADWDVQKGFDVCTNILTANPGIQGIFCANDQMALGAIKAIAAAGKTDDIVLLGYDATDEGRAAVAEGTMVGTVAQYPDDMGVKAMELAKKIIDGEDYEANSFVPTLVELITE
jgi:ribose transport system substrate-binding protein